jgi:DNA-binding GntR family transcriptional regulator
MHETMAAEPKRSRVDDAYGRIKSEILENRMPPGFQAPEPEITLKLGMSRTPVREAPIRLEAEGPIGLIPRRGARVLPISPDDILDKVRLTEL